VGKASMPNYQTLRDAAIAPFSRMNWSGTTFAGQADDSFFLDLRVFDLLYGGNLSEVGTDTLAGFNVNTIAIQVLTRTWWRRAVRTRSSACDLDQQAERVRRLLAGVPAGQPTGQRGGHSVPPQGPVQRLAALG
jgi:hypothetical protein